MDVSRKMRLARMSACRSDLADNGISTDAMGPRALCDLARRNIDYFQAMLGCDVGLREVVELMSSTSQSPRTRAGGVTGRRVGERDGAGRAARTIRSDRRARRA